MYIVKLTFNHDWPFFRQTPNFSGIWGNYKFVIDDNLKECDFWIIYSDYKLKEENVKCSRGNIIFIPAEGSSTSPKFSQKFLNQFGVLITTQRELKHKNIIYSHNANPWFINKSYDELISSEAPLKTKSISVISSNKTFVPGQKKRLEFVQKLKHHFGGKIDIYGRGVLDFEDKWEVVSPYKYSIAIENDFCDDWVTEKFFDCLYSETFTFYYGCPNLEKYVDSRSFQRIDINNFEESITTIERIINDSTHFYKIKDVLREAKYKSLNQDNFFPWAVSFLNKMNPQLSKDIIEIKTNTKMKSFKIIRQVLYKLRITSSIKNIYKCLSTKK